MDWRDSTNTSTIFEYIWWPVIVIIIVVIRTVIPVHASRSGNTGTWSTLVHTGRAISILTLSINSIIIVVVIVVYIVIIIVWHLAFWQFFYLGDLNAKTFRYLFTLTLRIDVCAQNCTFQLNVFYLNKITLYSLIWIVPLFFFTLKTTFFFKEQQRWTVSVCSKNCLKRSLLSSSSSSSSLFSIFSPFNGT